MKRENQHGIEQDVQPVATRKRRQRPVQTRMLFSADKQRDHGRDSQDRTRKDHRHHAARYEPHGDKGTCAAISVFAGILNRDALFRSVQAHCIQQ